MWFIFNHEPDSRINRSEGSPADYVAAWRRVVDVFRAQGAANVRFVWTLTNVAFWPGAHGRHAPGQWWPGGRYVDYVGADGYNWSSCRGGDAPWLPPARVFAGVREFAKARHKQIVLPEVGTTDQGGSKAAWLREFGAMLRTKAWGSVVAVSYFDAGDPRHPACHWPLGADPGVLAQFRGIGRPVG